MNQNKMTAHLVKNTENIAIYELLCSGDQIRINHFLSLYTQLFPQYAHYTPRMHRRTEFPQNHRAGQILHYWAIEVDGKFAGLRTFRYIHSRHCGIAIALAIHPDFRSVTVNGQRLSAFVIYSCLEQIIQDSISMGGPPALGMVNEVESPHLMKHYIQNGLIKLPVNYMEPIFPPEKRGRSREEEINQIFFSPMQLGFLKNPAIQVNIEDHCLIQNFTLAFLVEHYNLPENHPVVQKIIESIPTLP